MKLECPHCRQRIEIADEDLPGFDGVAFACPTCAGVIKRHFAAERSGFGQLAK